VVAGTYDIATSPSSTPYAAGELKTTTSTCAVGLNVTPTSGTVTLSQVSSTSVSGSYDITFGTQGSFTGSFDVAVCDSSGSLPTGDGGPATCTP
jgi:hypothetical protein